LLMPSSGAVTGASSRGDQSHPPARAPCRPPCPPCAGALRGGVTASPVGAARRRRAAAAAVAEAAPLFPPDAPPTTATWLYVPPCALAAIVRNPVPPDETQTAQDEPERHEVVRLLFACSFGERTPDAPRFSSDRVTIRPQRPVREVLVQASVRGIHTASPARSRFP